MKSTIHPIVGNLGNNPPPPKPMTSETIVHQKKGGWKPGMGSDKPSINCWFGSFLIWGNPQSPFIEKFSLAKTIQLCPAEKSILLGFSWFSLINRPFLGYLHGYGKPPSQAPTRPGFPDPVGSHDLRLRLPQRMRVRRRIREAILRVRQRMLLPRVAVEKSGNPREIPMEMVG